jgi:hypothetical protein
MLAGPGDPVLPDWTKPRAITGSEPSITYYHPVLARIFLTLTLRKSALFANLGHGTG